MRVSSHWLWPGISQELGHLGPCLQLDDGGGRSVFLDGLIQVRTAVLGITPYPSDELEINSLGTSSCLDCSTMMEESPAQSARKTPPPWRGQNNDGVDEWESDIERTRVVAVRYPPIRGQLFSLDDSPLVARGLHPAWLPVRWSRWITGSPVRRESSRENVVLPAPPEPTTAIRSTHLMVADQWPPRVRHLAGSPWASGGGSRQ